jgi:hypothetical protein
MSTLLEKAATRDCVCPKMGILGHCLFSYLFILTIFKLLFINNCCQVIEIESGTKDITEFVQFYLKQYINAECNGYDHLAVKITGLLD